MFQLFMNRYELITSIILKLLLHTGVDRIKEWKHNSGELKFCKPFNAPNQCLSIYGELHYVSYHTIRET